MAFAIFAASFAFSSAIAFAALSERAFSVRDVSSFFHRNDQQTLGVTLGCRLATQYSTGFVLSLLTALRAHRILDAHH